MDDIRPVRNTDGLNGYDKRTSQPYQRPVSNNQYTSPQPAPGQFAPQEYSPQPQPQQQPQHHDQPMLPAHASKKKSSKGLIASLILFILLFIAALGFAGWQYMQVQSLNEDIEELNSQVTQLKAQNYALDYDNRDLNQKLQLAEQQNADLLEKCGDDCKDTSATNN